MSILMQVSTAKGSFRNSIDEVIPTISAGTLIKNTEKGRAGYFPGTNFVNFGNDSQYNFGDGISDLPFSTSCIVKFHKVDSLRSIIGKHRNDNTGRGWWQVLNSGKLSLFLFKKTAFVFRGREYTTAVQPGIYYHIMSTYDGRGGDNAEDGICLYLNNVRVDNNNVTSGSNYVAMNPDNANLQIGTETTESTSSDLQMPSLIIADHIFSSVERAAYYQQSQAQQIIMEQVMRQKVLKDGSDAADVVVSDSGLNWNAEGTTQTAHIADWSVGSGSFRCLEDSTGKYLECVSNGTLLLKGVDLSALTGNGYIQELAGDLSGDAGGTIAAASNVAWATNIITLTLTAGQKLRSIVIRRAA